MSVLIAYGTVEGQTGKIARFIEDLVKTSGEDVRMVNTSDPSDDVDVECFDRVILAGSVHERRHPADFEVFLTANRKALKDRKTMLISVSLSAAFDQGLEEAQDYVDELRMRTELDPERELLVAGAVRSRNYGFYETQILRHVVLRGRDFDPSVKEHEFTDWDTLAGEVEDFLAPVEA